MRTLVIIEIDHARPIRALAQMIAGRAYSIQGVSNAEVVKLPSLSPEQLQDEGFTLAEISLGSREVVRT
jgi:hypothetical protein